MGDDQTCEVETKKESSYESKVVNLSKELARLIKGVDVLSDRFDSVLLPATPAVAKEAGDQQLLRAEPFDETVHHQRPRDDAQPENKRQASNVALGKPLGV